MESRHISLASLPILEGENESEVLQAIVPKPLTGLVPNSDSVLMVPEMYVALSERSSPELFLISKSSVTRFKEPDILWWDAESIMALAKSATPSEEIEPNFLSYVFSTFGLIFADGGDLQNSRG